MVEETEEDEEEEEDGLEYVTNTPSGDLYTTPPSTGGYSKPSPALSHSPTPCHCYDFLVCLRNELVFFELFKLLFSLGIDHNPHVFYIHITYVYSFSYVSFFTRSHGQEKSLSYYDLFDFRVLFYGCILTLVSFYFLHNPTPPPLYSPSMSINDGPTWRRIPPGLDIWLSGRSWLY